MHASAQRQGRCEHCTVRRCAGADVCVGSTGRHTACSCSEMAGSVRRHIAERVTGESGVATAGSCLESTGSCVQTALSCSEMAGTVQGAWTAWRVDRRAHGLQGARIAGQSLEAQQLQEAGLQQLGHQGQPHRLPPPARPLHLHREGYLRLRHLCHHRHPAPPRLTSHLRACQTSASARCSRRQPAGHRFFCPTSQTALPANNICVSELEMPPVSLPGVPLLHRCASPASAERWVPDP